MNKLFRNALITTFGIAAVLACGCAKSNNLATPVLLEDIHNPGHAMISAPKVEEKLVTKEVQITTNSTQPDQLAALRGQKIFTPVYGTIDNPKHAEWVKKNETCQELLKELNNPEAAKCLNAGKEPPKKIKAMVGKKEVVLPAAPEATEETKTILQQEIVYVTKEGSEVVVGFTKEGDFWMGDTFTVTDSVDWNTVKENPNGALKPRQTVQGKSGLDAAAGVLGIARDASIIGAAVKAVTGPDVTGQSDDTNVTVTQQQSTEICNQNNQNNHTTNIRPAPQHKPVGRKWHR